MIQQVFFLPPFLLTFPQRIPGKGQTFVSLVYYCSAQSVSNLSALQLVIFWKMFWGHCVRGQTVMGKVQIK